VLLLAGTHAVSSPRLFLTALQEAFRRGQLQFTASLAALDAMQRFAGQLQPVRQAG
jgi:hypothetical protein